MAHIQDRGKGVERRWQARYRDPSGKQVSKTFERKLDAGRWLDSVTADVVTGRYVDPKVGRVTLGVFAERWLATQTFDPATLERTERRLRLHVLPVLGDVELRNLRPSSVRSWLAAQEGAPSSVRVMLVNLSQVLSAAVDDGILPSNPCQSASVKAPTVDKRRIVPWTVAQVQAVVEVHPVRYRAVPTVAAGCGLRQGEVFGLRVDDVDFLGRRLLVRRQVKYLDGTLRLAPPKGRREREVPLPDVAAVALSERIRRNPPVDGVIFTSSTGRLIHGSHWNARCWKPALVEAGIEPTRDNGMHALRHHYASVLLDGGVSIRAVAEYLGHADPGFTLRTYAHLMPDTEDRARAVVDAAHGAPAESSLNQGTLDG